MSVKTKALKRMRNVKSSRLWRVYLHDKSSSRKPRLPHTIFVNGFWHKLRLVTFHSKITTHRNYLWSWLNSHLKNVRNVISHWRKLDSHQFMYSATRDCIPFDHLSSWYVNSQPLCFSARISFLSAFHQRTVIWPNYVRQLCCQLCSPSNSNRGIP